MHELGHNLDLGHGGDISDTNNCKPNYQSTMSYLSQVSGLLDSTGAPHIDYSHALLPTLNEGDLGESPSGFGTAALQYLPRWYAPSSSSFLSGIIAATPATKHCDGTPILDGAKYVRLDGKSLVASPLDWNGDGVTTGAALALDINFNGTITPSTSTGFLGFNDWASVNLQQIGARRSPSGDSTDVAPGQDTGDDQGIAGGDLGIAGGDLGIAGGDLGGELTYEEAKSVGPSPSTLSGTPLKESVGLIWSPPNVGTASHYTVWRATCPKNTTATTCALSPTVTPVSIATVTPMTTSAVPASKSSTSMWGSWNSSSQCSSIYNYCDKTTKDNVLYIYFVTATIDGNKSGASNQVTLGELPEGKQSY